MVRNAGRWRRAFLGAADQQVDERVCRKTVFSNPIHAGPIFIRFRGYLLNVLTDPTTSHTLVHSAFVQL